MKCKHCGEPVRLSRFTFVSYVHTLHEPHGDYRRCRSPFEARLAEPTPTPRP